MLLRHAQETIPDMQFPAVFRMIFEFLLYK